MDSVLCDRCCETRLTCDDWYVEAGGKHYCESCITFVVMDLQAELERVRSALDYCSKQKDGTAAERDALRAEVERLQSELLRVQVVIRSEVEKRG